MPAFSAWSRVRRRISHRWRARHSSVTPVGRRSGEGGADLDRPRIPARSRAARRRLPSQRRERHRPPRARPSRSLPPPAPPSTALLATGRLELSATRGTDAKDPVTDGLTFIIYEDDPDAQGGRREVIRSAAATPAFTLPAGTYYVTARTATAEARDQIAIGPGDAVRRTSAARTFAPAAIGRARWKARSRRSSAGLHGVSSRCGTKEVLRTVAKDPVLDLSAGRYRVEAAVSATNVARPPTTHSARDRIRRPR